MLKYRYLFDRIPGPDRRSIVVITGSRQTGKTTLARLRYPGLRYINLDSVEERETLAATRTAGWGSAVGPAVIDEAQKEPVVFEKVKYAFDGGEIDFTVLTGSSRFLLLRKISETLAGRALLFNLWPLMPCEVRSAAGSPSPPVLLDRLVTHDGPVGDVLGSEPAFLLASQEEPMLSSLDHVSLWGGMPALLDLDEAQRREWLRSFGQTFLERDISDIARLPDLRPLRSLMRLAMLRSGQILSYSELGRDAEIGTQTARRYLEHLETTYQVFLLRPFSRNLTSTVVKAPKLYWTDIGLLRQGTGRWGPIDGPLLETLVVVEIHKWCDTLGRDARLSFYRTRSGLEVDLLVETASGIFGVEVKASPAVSPADLRGLRSVGLALGERWRGGIVVYRGRELRPVGEGREIWAVPLHRLL